jgi:hypothetical protein
VAGARLIRRIVVGRDTPNSTPSVEFASLPQHFRHLRCQVNAQINAGAFTTAGNVGLTFNNDTDTANYTVVALYWNNGSVQGLTFHPAGTPIGNVHVGLWNGVASPSQRRAAQTTVLICNYSDARYTKLSLVETFLQFDTGGNSDYVWSAGGQWLSTEPIRSLRFTPSSSAPIMRGSTFSLYGEP